MSLLFLVCIIKEYIPGAHRTGYTDNPECRACCEEEETSIHLITECPALIMVRRDILGEFLFSNKEIIINKFETIMKLMRKVYGDLER